MSRATSKGAKKSPTPGRRTSTRASTPAKNSRLPIKKVGRSASKTTSVRPEQPADDVASSAPSSRDVVLACGVERLAAIVQVMEASSLTELQYEDEDIVVRLGRAPSAPRGKGTRASFEGHESASFAGNTASGVASSGFAPLNAAAQPGAEAAFGTPNAAPARGPAAQQESQSSASSGSGSGSISSSGSSSSAASAVRAPERADDAHVVRSPFVGTFYRSPSPSDPPFVEVGQRVSRGQTLCIVEAMKLMNEIEAEVEGVVLEIVAENSKPVQYGEALFRIARGS